MAHIKNRRAAGKSSTAAQNSAVLLLLDPPLCRQPHRLALSQSDPDSLTICRNTGTLLAAKTAKRVFGDDTAFLLSPLAGILRVTKVATSYIIRNFTGQRFLANRRIVPGIRKIRIPSDLQKLQKAKARTQARACQVVQDDSATLLLGSRKLRELAFREPRREPCVNPHRSCACPMPDGEASICA